jgi:hypothetical protein
MRRHLLLYRLRRRMTLSPLLREKPLVSYIVRQHTLPALLGLAGSPHGPTAERLPHLAPWAPAWLPNSPSLEALPSAEIEPVQALDGRPTPFVPAIAVPAVSEPEPSSQEVAPTLAEPPGAPGPAPAAAAGQLPEAAAPPALHTAEGPTRRPQRRRIIEPGPESHPAPMGAPTQRESEPQSLPERTLSRAPLTGSASAPVDRGARGASADEASDAASVEAAQLFAPRDTDRSPQAWLARLQRQAQAGQEQQEQERIAERTTQQPSVQRTWPAQTARAAPSISRPAPGDATSKTETRRQPAPVGAATRRFLKPLLGIDPAAVPSYRDAQAAEATAAAGAAALSDASAIQLAPQQMPDTPESVALLAHELTHVARRQQPRFLPPVLLAERVADETNGADVGNMLSGASTPGAADQDEEALALQVERRVRRLARTVRSAAHPPGPDGFSPPTAPPVQAVPSPSAPPQESSPARERGIWGNLPAPWEPLPSWLTTMPTSEAASPPAPLVVSSMPLATPGQSDQPDGTEEAPRRAGSERDLSEPVDEQERPAGGAVEARAPEPDLDALARQVYALLKRRLGVEQRRSL